MTTNHPANDPVSLARLHQIREHLQHDTQYSNGGNRAYILTDMLKVIDQAIASFGAKPVEFLPDNLDRALTILGVALPISKEEFNLDAERWMQRLINRVIRLENEMIPPAQVVPDTLPCPVFLEPGLRFGKGVTTSLMLGALQRRAEYYAELDAMTPEQRAEHDAGIAEFKTMLGNTEVSVPTKEGA